MPRLSRWYRGFLVATVVVALVMSRGYYSHGPWGTVFGIRRNDGSALCGFTWTKWEVGVGCWRSNRTIIFGAGGVRGPNGWSAGMNTLDSANRVVWQRSIEF